MPRAAGLFLTLFGLALCGAGCQIPAAGTPWKGPSTALRIDEPEREPSRLRDAGEKDRRWQFAAMSEASGPSASVPRLVRGDSDRIPLPESSEGRLRQIDAPKQPSDISIGAF